MGLLSACSEPGLVLGPEEMLQEQVHLWLHGLTGRRLQPASHQQGHQGGRSGLLRSAAGAEKAASGLEVRGVLSL